MQRSHGSSTGMEAPAASPTGQACQCPVCLPAGPEVKVKGNYRGKFCLSKVLWAVKHWLVGGVPPALVMKIMAGSCGSGQAWQIGTGIGLWWQEDTRLLLVPVREVTAAAFPQTIVFSGL